MMTTPAPHLSPAPGWVSVSAYVTRGDGSPLVVVNVDPLAGWLVTADRIVPATLDPADRRTVRAMGTDGTTGPGRFAHRLTSTYGRPRRVAPEGWEPWLSYAYGLPVLLPPLALPEGETAVRWYEFGEPVRRMTVVVDAAHALAAVLDPEDDPAGGMTEVWPDDTPAPVPA